MTGSGADSVRKKKFSAGKGKKSRKKDKKGKSKLEDDAEYDSDLDLERQLKPIGGYIRDRDQMIEHMFKCIQGPKLKGMLPEVLKPLPHDELKKLCLEQLEIMSKKRIRKILEGVDPHAISSSGTEEESSESEDEKVIEKKKAQSHAADSTSQAEADLGHAVVGENAEAAGDWDAVVVGDAGEDLPAEDDQDQEQFDLASSHAGEATSSDEYGSGQEVSEPEMETSDEEVEGQDESEGEAEGVEGHMEVDEHEDSEMEEGEVREVKVVPKAKKGIKAKRKTTVELAQATEEVQSAQDSLPPGGQQESTEDISDDVRQIVDTDVAEPQPGTSKVTEVEEEQSGGSDMSDDESDSDDGIDIDADFKAVARHDSGGELQVLSQTQMEILELEMRARAIKAMLKATEIKERRMEMAQRNLGRPGMAGQGRKVVTRVSKPTPGAGQAKTVQGAPQAKPLQVAAQAKSSTQVSTTRVPRGVPIAKRNLVRKKPAESSTSAGGETKTSDPARKAGEGTPGGQVREAASSETGSPSTSDTGIKTSPSETVSQVSTSTQDTAGSPSAEAHDTPSSGEEPKAQRRKIIRR